MRKIFIRLALIMLLAAMAISVFVACENTQKQFNVRFISDDVEYANAMTAEEAKEYLNSLPTRDGYVFQGWYLDKDEWRQEVKADDIENYISNGNFNVYAKWGAIVDAITIVFLDYNNAVLLDRQFDRADVDLTFLKPSVKPTDNQYTYTFSHWDCDMSDLTLAMYTATPVYNKELRTFEVKYFDQGELIYSEKVKYGENASADVVTPDKRPSTPKFDYKFVGWDGEWQNIKSDVSLRARWEENLRKYKVEFNFGDSLKETKYINYGEAAIAPTNVQKSSDPQYDYRFTGWDNVFDNVRSDTVVNAVYVGIARIYEVSFWVDDTCIQSTSELYGANVTAPANVVKVRDDGYTYQFTGWDKTFDNITGHTKVNAIFDKIANKYKVTYVDWNGKILFVDEVETDEASVYQGDEPSRASNQQYEYTFAGWSDSDKLSCVKSSFEVYAIYDENIRTFNVTFNYGRDKQKVIEDVEFGSDLLSEDVIPTDTDKESDPKYDYTFVGWKYPQQGYLGYITSDMEINAIYTETIRRYIVKFINDGTVVKTQEVAYDDYPTAPLDLIMNDTVQYNYTFLGWGLTDDAFVGEDNQFQALDVNNTAVVGEITYTAVYLRKTQRYTVSFFNEITVGNRVKVLEVEVDYGTNATSLAPEASKESTVAYEYTFAGWNKDIEFISANIEVDATYTQELRTYTVTFYNGDEVYAEYKVQYSKASPRPEVNPTKNSTVEHDFEFLNWIGGIGYIEGDTRVEADYKAITRKYLVTLFNLATYELLTSIELFYGSPIDIKIERDGYYFDSWYRDPECTTMFNTDTEFVDGVMMLFGNTVMKGIEHDGSTITGYSGTNPNVILPFVIKGTKMNTIKKEAFANNAVMESIYIPDSYTSVKASVFKNIAQLDIYTQVNNAPALDYPYGWSMYWNSDSAYMPGIGNSQRIVTNGVDGIFVVGDYQYILKGSQAIINKFVNNNSARAYIEANLEYNKPYFEYVLHVDDKTGQERNIYTVNYTAKKYEIKTISQSAFQECNNLVSVFIPNTITAVKKYAFSGTSANIYIQRNKPAIGDVPGGWDLNWNANRKGHEGERTLYWGVVGMDQVGDYTYIFKGDGTAIAAEFNGNKTTTLKVSVPATVEYKDPNGQNGELMTYTVTELGAEIFANMAMLNEVEIAEGVKKIGNKAFYMDTRLSDIKLPSTLEEIGAYAFVANNALKEIWIPATKVGAFAFAGSSATIYMRKEKKLVDTNLGLYWNIKLGFEDISKLTNIKDIAGLVFSPEYLPTYWNVANIYTDVATETGKKSNMNYILYNDGTAELIACSGVTMTRHVENYVIPEAITVDGKTYTVTAIKGDAFKDNGQIKTLTIPATVTTIGANAFAGCGKLTIYTAHTSKPSGWDDAFNPNDRPINYGTSNAAVEQPAA